MGTAWIRAQALNGGGASPCGPIALFTRAPGAALSVKTSQIVGFLSAGGAPDLVRCR